jgi:hypothetical protein
MKNFISKVKEKSMKSMIRIQMVLSDNRGETFIDTAIFSVQGDYDTMNMIQKIKYKVKKCMFNVMNNLNVVYGRTRVILADQSGQGALDQVVSILISIVLGALLLAGLYALFADTLLPAIQEKLWIFLITLAS